MALKDFYELSALLRMQLPVLLSFSIMRCLMGTATNLSARAVLPERVLRRFGFVNDIIQSVLSFVYSSVILAAFFFWLLSFDSTRDACAEYPVTRVQGLVCSVGLLALLTSGEPFVHALALATLKTVADQSSFGLVLAVLTRQAFYKSHISHQRIYFTLLFVSSISYGVRCYTEDVSRDRTHGATLAASFGVILLIWRVYLKLLGAWLRTLSTALKLLQILKRS